MHDALAFLMRNRDKRTAGGKKLAPFGKDQRCWQASCDDALVPKTRSVRGSHVSLRPVLCLNLLAFLFQTHVGRSAQQRGGGKCPTP